jgi:hypothetical protein
LWIRPEVRWAKELVLFLSLKYFEETEDPKKLGGQRCEILPKEDKKVPTRNEGIRDPPEFTL